MLRIPVAFALLGMLARAQDPAADASATLDQLLGSARSAYTKGDYTTARASLDLAWSAVQKSPPAEPRRYEILKQLEAVLSAAGDYKTAQEYQELAINWRENNIGLDDPKLPEEWIELATLCQRQKDFARALALLQFAQGRHISVHGRDSLPVADDFSRIALLHSSEQKLDLAIQPLQMAIRIREAVLGAEHPAILAELDRLAAAQITLRHYADAEETFRRSLVIRERLTGPVHADLIATVEGLAYAQFGQKKYIEAEAGYKRLLSLWVFSTQQPDHPMIAMTLDKMASFYRAQQRWEEGEEAAGKSIAIRGLFLAYELQHEAAEQLARGNSKASARLLQRAVDTLDESRPEHAELRQQLQAALREMAGQNQPVKPAVTRSTRSAPAKSTTAITTKPR